MINSITICNQGLSEFPDGLTIAYENRHIHISFISGENSIFRTIPCLYSVIAADLILFQTTRIEEPGSTVSLEKYTEALVEYLPKYIDLEMRKATTKMDLVRLYFRINDISRAKSLLDGMEDEGDVRMLRFIIRHKFEMVEGRLQERPARASRIWEFNGIANDSSGMDLQVESGKMHKAFDEFVRICSMIDEHTRFIFACEVLEIFPSDFYFLIEHHAGLTLLECSVFIKIQMADVLIRRGKNKIATLMLIQASRSIQHQLDMVLKRSLMKHALELVTDASWSSYFLSIVREVEEEEIKTYGLPVSVQNDTCLLMPVRQYPAAVFESCDEIFQFNVVKTSLDDHFIDQIRVRIPGNCQGRAPIMGVFESEEQFYPVYSSGMWSILTLDSSVRIKKIVLEDGTEICCDKQMHRILKATDVELVDVIEGPCKRMCFAFKNGMACKFYTSEDIGVSMDKAGFCLLVPRATKEVRMTVEIQESIYESRTYGLDGFSL